LRALAPNAKQSISSGLSFWSPTTCRWTVSFAVVGPAGGQLRMTSVLVSQVISCLSETRDSKRDPEVRDGAGSAWCVVRGSPPTEYPAAQAPWSDIAPVKLDSRSYALPLAAIRDSLIGPSGSDALFEQGRAEIPVHHMGHGGRRRRAKSLRRRSPFCRLHTFVPHLRNFGADTRLRQVACAPPLRYALLQRGCSRG
jgi:hypothetical protein